MRRVLKERRPNDSVYGEEYGEFEGQGLEEVGIVTAIEKLEATKVSVGDVVIRIDKRYFRPTEVEALIGNPAKAKERLGWAPKISVKEMCAEMVAADLQEAKKQVLMMSNGFDTSVESE